jgi:hypothetical protein
MNLFLLLPLLLLNTFSRDPLPAKVYFIPTIHSFHKVNPHYTYDSLEALVKALHPSVIAVEIRREDIAGDSSYLKQNYPYEMWMMKYWFPGVKIQGFDWLGKDIENKSIPGNYWKEISAIKQWERALAADSFFTNKLSTCDSFSHERSALLRSGSLKELLAGKDEQLTNDFYACLQQQLRGSVHERVVKFYDERNRHILQNINDIIRNNPGQTIVILTGDDHYQQLRHKFQAASYEL